MVAIDVAAAIMSAMFIIWKSSSLPAPMRWRCLSSSVTCCWTSAIASLLTADTCMLFRKVTPVSLFITVVYGASMVSSWSPPKPDPFFSSTPTILNCILLTRTFLPMGSALPNRFSATVLPIMHTFAASRTSCSLNGTPLSTFQSLISRKSILEPWILVFQFWFP